MKMNDAIISQFRCFAETLADNKPQDWQWIGPHMSQRMFGITEQRAKDYAARHGGIASRMKVGR
jgi:hypothetical protein